MTPRFGDFRLSRRERLIGRIDQRRRILFYAKLALGAAALLLLGLLTLLPAFRDEGSNLRIALTASTSPTDDRPVMRNPKFQGVDNKDQPYTITAAKALQADTDTVQLHKLSADMTMHGGSWLSLSSDRGLLKLDRKKLYLLGHVRMFHDDGYEMTTDRIRIDTASGDVLGDRPVEGQGPLGHFRAQGFEICDKGERMLFAGRVFLTILPNAS